MTPTALIAEDEPLLAAELIGQLETQWPELSIVAQVGNGIDAIEKTRQLKPSMVFLDIRMPGATGLEVAQALAEDPEEDQSTVPLVVFVTAYGEFAVDAFEAAAIDYVLKPVTPERLALTVSRLRQRLEPRAAAHSAEYLAQQLGQLLAGARTTPGTLLRHVRVGQGNSVRLVPLEEVLYFQAADKYVIVMTAQGEGLIRESLRDLQPRLDPDVFTQIHRGTIVNLRHVDRAERDDLGRTRLILRDARYTLMVSRLYAGLFKPM